MYMINTAKLYAHISFYNSNNMMAKSAVFAVFMGCLLMQGKAMPADTLSAVNSDDPPDLVTNVQSAMYYMKYYNDMDSDGTEGDMPASLMDFQRFANLPQTGELDNATMAKMNADRCGVRDNMGMTTKERKRAKRFDAVVAWPRRTITWRLNAESPDLARNDIRQIMRRALTVWSDVAQITFVEDTNPATKVDFNIEFYSNQAVHPQVDDRSRFDGRGRVLAHAFFPPRNGILGEIHGDAHFDDDEQFTEGTNNGINLFQVAAHEFGHSLGLGHSNDDDALMAAFYRGYQANFMLHQDDINGIQYLYGANTGQPEVTMPPMPTMRPDEPVDPTNCPGVDLDAVVTTSTDGENFRTFLLKGGRVWEHFGNMVSGPMAIGNVFPGLPSNVDAGLYLQPYVNPGSGRTYIFKGADVYTYRGDTLVSDGPEPISEVFSGLPNDIDSAFVWSGNGRPYFTKGNQYWRYNPYTGQVDNGYPRPLSVWDLPDANGEQVSRVDAAFQFTNYRTYFFYGDQYIRYDDVAFGVDEQTTIPYPRNIGEWWFGCTSNADLYDDSGALATVFPSMILLAFSTFLAFTVKCLN